MFVSSSSLTGAYVTLFYDHGPESAARFLATRVLMQSIALTNTKYDRVVLVPSDGISQDHLNLLTKDGITVRTTTIPNVFISQPSSNPYATLKHWRNLLIIWRDETIKQYDRVLYLNEENIVLSNLDHLMECTALCAVDPGQAIVYANSLLVITPSSQKAHAILQDAIDAFTISGKEYGYVGITQGFIPGLYQAIEASPLFTYASINNQEDNVIVRRLPFYYSINHMVYYERLNWDLYRCDNTLNSLDNTTHLSLARGIPGPLLSFKYGGASMKPWCWFGYVYFNVYWIWLQAREVLQEDHFGFFIKTVLDSILLSCIVWLMVWTSITWPTTRKVWLRICASPVPRNVAVVIMIFLLNIWSLFVPPMTMHPMYACKIWLFWQLVLLSQVLLSLSMLSTKNSKGGLNDSTKDVAVQVLSKVIWTQLPLQLFFLFCTHSAYYSHPVQKPVILFCLLTSIILNQLRLVLNAASRV